LNQKLNLIVALAAGLVGSAIMHYIAPPLAFAQDQAPVARDIRAQSFTLVDQANNVIGIFTSEPLPGAQVHVAPGSSVRVPSPVRVPSHVVLRDQNGRVIWTPDSNTKLLPLTMR
jgi:hypothetical protein